MAKNVCNVCPRNDCIKQAARKWLKRADGKNRPRWKLFPSVSSKPKRRSVRSQLKPTGIGTQVQFSGTKVDPPSGTKNETSVVFVDLLHFLPRSGVQLIKPFFLRHCSSCIIGYGLYQRSLAEGEASVQLTSLY
jgi:hypothetical protein